jgi:hypothetical protein
MGAHWRQASAALKLGFQWGFGLRHRSDVGRSFHLPLNDGGRRLGLATERWFGQDITTVRATHSASSMTWTAPIGVADLREAPGTVGLRQAATPVRQWGRAVG